jgi:hypothetical protein
VPRLFLAVWLAVFAVPAIDLLAVIAPDSCTEETAGSAMDPCQEGCPRCLCCARVSAFIPALPDVVSSPARAAVTALPQPPGVTPLVLHPIFHVPKLG